ncbi:MAG: PqqD family protein [Candidatus Kaelpia imicola]|nr:PqqD family protein [Candidatus Kaelpia imicola]
MTKDSQVLKKSKKFVVREIEGEVILLPLYKSSQDIKYLYTLNDVAARVWKLINGKKTLSEIKQILLKEFDTTRNELKKELSAFLKDLKEIEAII